MFGIVCSTDVVGCKDCTGKGTEETEGVLSERDNEREEGGKEGDRERGKEIEREGGIERCAHVIHVHVLDCIIIVYCRKKGRERRKRKRRKGKPSRI